MKMTRITIIFLVACLTLMARETREAIANPKSIVQAEAKSTVKPIPVSLPRNETVFLKSGDSRYPPKNK
jgi:biopolymer transport protein ExbD